MAKEMPSKLLSEWIAYFKLEDKLMKEDQMDRDLVRDTEARLQSNIKTRKRR